MKILKIVVIGILLSSVAFSSSVENFIIDKAKEVTNTKGESKGKDIDYENELLPQKDGIYETTHKGEKYTLKIDKGSVVTAKCPNGKMVKFQQGKYAAGSKHKIFITGLEMECLAAAW